MVLSGLPLNATPLMDNAGNQEPWVNKTIEKKVVRMLGRSVTLRDEINTAARETRLRAVY